MYSPRPDTDDSTPTVVVVDDEAQIGRFIAMCLERLGLHPVVCQTVAEAREYLDSHPVALVLTDLLMPGEGGEELIRWMEVHHPHIPVVVITAYAANMVAAQVDHAQVQAVLTKPFTVRQLDQTVNDLLWPREVGERM